MSSRLPRSQDEGKAAVFWKKLSAVGLIVGITSRMCKSGGNLCDRTKKHPKRGLADESNRAHCSHDALGAKACEDSAAQLPTSLGAEVVLLPNKSFLKKGRAACLREALGRCCINEEHHAVAQAADDEHALDRSQQLAIKSSLGGVLLDVTTLPKLCADGVALW
eukprot:3811015-Pleurochrysis_carterae.AAC.3